MTWRKWLDAQWGTVMPKHSKCFLKDCKYKVRVLVVTNFISIVRTNMSYEIHTIIDKKKEMLLQLQSELESELNTYSDSKDFNAIVFLQAIKSLDL